MVDTRSNQSGGLAGARQKETNHLPFRPLTLVNLSYGLAHTGPRGLRRNTVVRHYQGWGSEVTVESQRGVHPVHRPIAPLREPVGLTAVARRDPSGEGAPWVRPRPNGSLRQGDGL